MNADQIVANLSDGGAAVVAGFVAGAGVLGLGVLVLVTYLAAAVRAS